MHKVRQDIVPVNRKPLYIVYKSLKGYLPVKRDAIYTVAFIPQCSTTAVVRNLCDQWRAGGPLNSRTRDDQTGCAERRSAIIHYLRRNMLHLCGGALRRRLAIAQNGGRLGRGSAVSRIVGSRFQGYVYVFKEFSGSDAEETIEDLDQVIACLAGLLAAEGVGENQRVGKLTSAHDETRAIDGPITFHVHDLFTLWGRAVAVA